MQRTTTHNHSGRHDGVLDSPEEKTMKTIDNMKTIAMRTMRMLVLTAAVLTLCSTNAAAQFHTDATLSAETTAKNVTAVASFDSARASASTVMVLGGGFGGSASLTSNLTDVVVVATGGHSYAGVSSVLLDQVTGHGKISVDNKISDSRAIASFAHGAATIGSVTISRSSFDGEANVRLNGQAMTAVSTGGASRADIGSIVVR
jgi:hypothetical protein